MATSAADKVVAKAASTRSWPRPWPPRTRSWPRSRSQRTRPWPRPHPQRTRSWPRPRPRQTVASNSSREEAVKKLPAHCPWKGRRGKASSQTLLGKDARRRRRPCCPPPRDCVWPPSARWPVRRENAADPGRDAHGEAVRFLFVAANARRIGGSRRKRSDGSRPPRRAATPRATCPPSPRMRTDVETRSCTVGVPSPRLTRLAPLGDIVAMPAPS